MTLIEKDILIGNLKEDIHTLYGQLYEKDKEIAAIQDNFKITDDARQAHINELLKEIERLKGLLKEQQFSIDFIMWYSGMNEDSVRQGYKQYLQNE